LTAADALEARLTRIRSARVAVVGDVMLDRFVYGTVERISPEAPIPVVQIEAETAALGGAGNVVRNIAALEAAVAFFSVIGVDAASDRITALLDAERNVTARLVREPARQATVKTRYFAGSQQLLRADQETVAPIAAASADEIVAVAAAALAACDVLVLSDYAKGVLTEALVRRLIDTATKAGRPVIVDPKARDFARYRGADIVTPNDRELALAAGLPARTDAEVEAAARAVIARTGIATVLATRGNRGMSIVTRDRVDHLPVKARAVFDVSGAGDTVIAALAAAIAAGAPVEEAAALANYAAAIVVGKVGTAVARPHEIVDALNDRDLTAAEAKLATRDEARARVAGWRRTGLKVGFTNGCFDLLHPGHVSLLEQAGAACDRLIVGLNSDASVKRLKGPDRPINGERERALMLGSHGVVDLVVVFDEDTPLALIEALRPDVLIKGADYALDQVVGGDLVQSYGGRVVLAKLKAGYSTTNVIGRLKQTAS
jgi:D-beta-D-heptose 7-phosphate kinase/D-beta-D-heptose 1-phosphate adenosyltransferase